jgi:signal transduction histidine kinase
MSYRPTVLILASDSAFSRDLTEAWPAGGANPQFVLLEEDRCRELPDDTFDLAIAHTASPEKHVILTQALRATRKPAILVHHDPTTAVCRVHGSIVELHRDTCSWPEMPALLGGEILRRLQFEARAAESHHLLAVADRDAALGRYMAENFSTINNALTSVMGNAELLLLEPGLPATVLAQADTIRNMALRLHEVFQRFSSLDKELSVVAREFGKKIARAQAAGS